jgi:hypothetical protein
MAFRLRFPISLPATYAGEALRARFFDDAGAPIQGLPGSSGAPDHTLAATFLERGNGYWVWTYGSIPDGIGCGVEFLDEADNVVGVSVINEAELTGGATGGAFAVTATITDAVSADPVLGALVTLKTALGTIIDRRYTDADGMTSPWAIDAGNYLVSINPSAGHNSLSDQPITVAADGNFDFEVDPFTTTPPASAAVCSVEDVLIDGSGAPVADYTVSAQPSPLPQWTDAALVGGEDRTDNTDADGIFTLQLVRGKSYHFKLPLWGVSKVLVVPDAANSTLRAMLEAQA